MRVLGGDATMNIPTQTVERSLHVNAPIKRVFDYVADTANLPKIWAGMLEVRNMSKLSTGGRRFNWVCRMQGVRFEGEAETVVYTPLEHITDQYRGGMSRTVAWVFQQEAEGTRVNIKMDYNIPAPLIPKHETSAIVMENIKIIETTLIKLKAMVEDGNGSEYQPTKPYKEV